MTGSLPSTRWRTGQRLATSSRELIAPEDAPERSFSLFEPSRGRPTPRRMNARPRLPGHRNCLEPYLDRGDGPNDGVCTKGSLAGARLPNQRQIDGPYVTYAGTLVTNELPEQPRHFSMLMTKAAARMVHSACSGFTGGDVLGDLADALGPQRLRSQLASRVFHPNIGD